MKDGLIHESGDVVSLRGRIDFLASDRKLLSRLRRNSLAGAGELTWEKAAQSLIAAYRRCLSER